MKNYLYFFWSEYEDWLQTRLYAELDAYCTSQFDAVGLKSFWVFSHYIVPNTSFPPIRVEHFFGYF